MLAPSSFAHGAAPDPDAIRAVTAPSKDRTLAFDESGRIARLLVREGQAVKVGQLLVQLDDALERVQLGSLKTAADGNSAVAAAQLRLAHARAVLGRVEKAHAQKAAPESELDNARFEAALAALQVELERLERAKARGRYEEALVRLERMRLVSPIDGTVERLFAREGESVEAARGVVRVVCTDPLWIDAPVPPPLARRLNVGAAAQVRFVPGGPPAAGKVIRIASVADAASETIEVRVELPNPSARPAGEQVSVSFAAGGK